MKTARSISSSRSNVCPSFLKLSITINSSVPKTLHITCKTSLHVILIRINQPTRCNSFTSLLLDVCVWPKMFGASPRPSSGAYNCTRSLWFYRWREAAGALLVVVLQDNLPDHDQQRSCTLLMTGGETPEIC